jgi:hypothetical protein
VRRNEAPARRRVEFGDQPALCFHLRAIVADRLLRVLVNQRTDISGNLPGIADDQRFERALQHLQNLLLDILLDVQDAQRRAALAGALEG